MRTKVTHFRGKYVSYLQITSKSAPIYRGFKGFYGVSGPYSLFRYSQDVKCLCLEFKPQHKQNKPKGNIVMFWAEEKAYLKGINMQISNL